MICHLNVLLPPPSSSRHIKQHASDRAGNHLTLHRTTQCTKYNQYQRREYENYREGNPIVLGSVFHIRELGAKICAH